MKRLGLASISALLIFGVGACKAPSAPGGFGVNLTIESNALGSSVRSSIASATLHVTGDQPDPYTTPLDIAGPLHAGKATFRYLPQVHAGVLDLHVDVFDGSGQVLSSGDSGPVALTSARSATAKIVLGAANPVHMSVADAGVDMGLVDLARVDLTSPPDLTPGKPNNCFAIFQCEFVNGKPMAVCQAGKPQVAKDDFNAVISCMDTACGLNVDGGATSPCGTASMATDAGADTCNTCLLNTLYGPNTIFGNMTGGSQNCSPDNNAPHCGACTTRIMTCVEQCVTDADCQGFSMPLTCQNGTCM